MQHRNALRYFSVLIGFCWYVAYRCIEDRIGDDTQRQWTVVIVMVVTIEGMYERRQFLPYKRLVQVWLAYAYLYVILLHALRVSWCAMCGWLCVDCLLWASEVNYLRVWLYWCIEAYWLLLLSRWQVLMIWGGGNLNDQGFDLQLIFILLFRDSQRGHEVGGRYWC